MSPARWIARARSPKLLPNVTIKALSSRSTASRGMVELVVAMAIKAIPLEKNSIFR
jgi:hypothetical protein